MGTKADFYIDINRPRWIGSIDNNGEPYNIPCKILIQNNPIMYEETVVEFLMKKEAVIESEDHPWPWLWKDSKLTDYSYIFSLGSNVVFVYSMIEKKIYNPIKILQGLDLDEAFVSSMIIDFPKMKVVH